MIIIDRDGDLTVKVVEYEGNTHHERSVRQTEDYRVSRRILFEASRPWRIMLGSLSYTEGSSDHVTFGDDPVQSTEILLRVLHNAVDDSTYEASLEDIWKVVAIVKKWDVNIALLNQWFLTWYENTYLDEDELDVAEQRMLLFPCWRFDNAKGFGKATHFLAYNYHRHITEMSPDDLESNDLHLPHRIISQLNAAKGRLRTILHRALYSPIKRLLQADCRCKAETLHGYEKALFKTGAWPLEENFASVNRALDQLKNFEYKVAESACMSSCHQCYEAVVKSAINRTEQYFNGLCLDCMDRLKPRFGDHHDDYWNHNDFRSESAWIKGCRIPHRQSTWYFSFMGRSEDRQYLQSASRDNERLRNEHHTL